MALKNPMEADQLLRIHRLYTNLGIQFDPLEEVGYIDDISWFVGKQMDLTAVDLDLPKGKEKQWNLDKYMREHQHANRLIFTCYERRSNGNRRKLSFMLIEDESDGYRSSLDKILVHTRYVPHNVFDPVHVQFLKAGTAEDKLACANVFDSGRRVLTFGTQNTDDYYPAFVGDFELQNLPANVLRAKEGSERLAKANEQQRQQQTMASARSHLGWGEF